MNITHIAFAKNL